MRRLFHQHIRPNAVAYLALFVALGGTSYAAINLPAGSVGTTQLRNGAVTSKKLANGSVSPRKLDPRGIGGSVRHWASVSADGRVLGGSQGAQVSGGSDVYFVSWGDRFSSRCAVVATSPGVVAHSPIADSVGVQTIQPAKPHGSTMIWVFPYSAGTGIKAPFNVVVIC